MQNSDNSLKAYFAEHRGEHLEQLNEFLKIESISALSEHKTDVRKAAEWVADALKKAGMEHVELLQTSGNPVVYGDWLNAPGKPTALVYGHYDVQPVDPLNLWDSPPFEPEIRGGKLYARGATDDKGQLFLHIKAAEALIKMNGELPVNLKFCIEGEEEIGSVNLPSFVEKHADTLKNDAVVISDSSMYDVNQPAICYGLRGLCSLEVSVHTANTDLHSGFYGGGVPNALHAMVELLASLHDSEGKVAVEGFYDQVRPLTDKEREAFAALGFDTEKLKKSLGLSSLYGEKGYSYMEQTWARPTLEINGVYGGFQGEGTKTVIPKEAHAKITCRLVENQDPDRILDLIEKHMQTHAPAGSQCTMTKIERGNPFLTQLDDPAIQAAAKAYEDAYGVTPVYIRGGGSIPIVETFHRLLGSPVVLMGFGLPDENLHAPNEHFNLDNFDKGLLTLCSYWKELSQA